MLWFSRIHNDYGCSPFLNLMYAAGRHDEDFLSLLGKDAASVLGARDKDDGCEVWIFVLHNGENVKRSDKYAQEKHKARDWNHFVDWHEGSNLFVRVTDLLDYNVDVAVAIQRVGQLVVGGPGVGHGVVQYGTTLAVAVNVCSLDFLYLPVRMAKGGDLC